MSDWRQPWMGDEWLGWWKSLDHSFCTQYSSDPDAPPYERCHSMHCGDCGRSTGGQGHANCPERTPETQAAAERRLAGGMAGYAMDAVNREAEACED